MEVLRALSSFRDTLFPATWVSACEEAIVLCLFLKHRLVFFWILEKIFLKLFQLDLIKCINLHSLCSLWVSQVSFGHLWWSNHGFADNFTDVPHDTLLNIRMHLVTVGLIPILCHVNLLEW